MTPAEAAGRVWLRLVRCLMGAPLVINTQPPLYPEWANRRDRLDHAWINVFTEGWRRVLRRPAGDELSQRLGQATGIAVPVCVLVLVAL